MNWTKFQPSLNHRDKQQINHKAEKEEEAVEHLLGEAKKEFIEKLKQQRTKNKTTTIIDSQSNFYPKPNRINPR